MFNKKSKMMIEATRIKLMLIEETLLVLENSKDYQESEIYKCRIAQKVILKELLRELEMIKNGKAIVGKRS